MNLFDAEVKRRTQEIVDYRRRMEWSWLWHGVPVERAAHKPRKAAEPGPPRFTISRAELADGS